MAPNTSTEPRQISARLNIHAAFQREKTLKERPTYKEILLLYVYVSWSFFFLSQTTARLYLAINCLPWTLVTLCGVISVTFIMRLLTRL